MKISLLILNLISLINLNETNQYKQLIWILLGTFLFYKITHLKRRYSIKVILPIYIGLNLLLVYLLLKGTLTNGSKGWLTLGTINIQPSEFLKPTLILLNTYLLKYKNKYLFIGSFILPSILTFLEPDTGGVLFYGIIFLSFIPYYYSKKDILYFLGITLILGILFLLVCLYHKEHFVLTYRLKRLLSFYKQDNLQVKNAIISIGAQQDLYYPEKYNDFFLAHILSTNKYYFFPIIGCYSVILYTLSKKKNRVSNSTYWILLFQILENISMNLGFLPVIGIPLPFLSYGGSNLITNYILLALSMDNKA